MYSACNDDPVAQTLITSALRASAAEEDWHELWILLGQIGVWIERGIPRLGHVELSWWIREARSRVGQSVSEVADLTREEQHADVDASNDVAIGPSVAVAVKVELPGTTEHAVPAASVTLAASDSSPQFLTEHCYVCKRSREGDLDGRVIQDKYWICRDCSGRWTPSFRLGDEGVEWPTRSRSVSVNDILGTSRGSYVVVAGCRRCGTESVFLAGADQPERIPRVRGSARKYANSTWHSVLEDDTQSRGVYNQQKGKA